MLIVTFEFSDYVDIIKLKIHGIFYFYNAEERKEEANVTIFSTRYLIDFLIHVFIQ